MRAPASLLRCARARCTRDLMPRRGYPPIVLPSPPHPFPFPASRIPCKTWYPRPRPHTTPAFVALIARPSCASLRSLYGGCQIFSSLGATYMELGKFREAKTTFEAVLQRCDCANHPEPARCARDPLLLVDLGMAELGEKSLDGTATGTESEKHRGRGWRGGRWGAGSMVPCGRPDAADVRVSCTCQRSTTRRQPTLRCPPHWSSMRSARLVAACHTQWYRGGYPHRAHLDLEIEARLLPSSGRSRATSCSPSRGL